jgi:hypothetical protein
MQEIRFYEPIKCQKIKQVSTYLIPIPVYGLLVHGVEVLSQKYLLSSIA